MQIVPATALLQAYNFSLLLAKSRIFWERVTQFYAYKKTRREGGEIYKSHKDMGKNFLLFFLVDILGGGLRK